MIKDTNNLNNLILVEEKTKTNLMQTCKKNNCQIIPKQYEDAKKNDKKNTDYEKNNFLGTAFAIGRSYSNSTGNLDPSAGLGATFDLLIYKYDLGRIKLSFGVTSNMIYSNYQLKEKTFRRNMEMKKCTW